MTANQIAYWNLQEQKRANMAKEAENYRSNTAKESELYRSNVAKELENVRSNQAREAHNTRVQNWNELYGVFGKYAPAADAVGDVVSDLKEVGETIPNRSDIPKDTVIEDVTDVVQGAVDTATDAMGANPGGLLPFIQAQANVKGLKNPTVSSLFSPIKGRIQTAVEELLSEGAQTTLNPRKRKQIID